MRKETAKKRLARLRLRLTLTFGLMSLIGIGSLAVVTTVIDGQLRDDGFGTELQGRASRAAALVFFDDTIGEWNVSGVADDTVAEVTDGIVIYDVVNDVELFATAEIAQAESIIARTLADDANRGVTGDVVIGGKTLKAAGAPFFSPEGDESADEVVGVVIVATQRSADFDQRRLVSLVWTTAMALVVLSTATSWLISGRVIRPLGAQLDREEAFLATAAHELRTPLGRVRAVAESALLSTRQLPRSPTRNEVLADIHRLIQLNEETTKSIEDLLLLGRIEAGQLDGHQEAVRLDRLVADFEGSIPELVVETSTAVTINADPLLVHHAMSNIFVNAQRHARQPDVALLIEASVTVVGDEAVVTVTDNGPGITDPVKIFLRHHTTSSSGGLGLWIVQTLLQERGGRVSARNVPEGGACFELRWPIVAP